MGASCLGVGRPGSCPLRPPTTRPFGRAARAGYPLAVGAVCGRRGPAVLGTFPRAAVRRVLCALPWFAAPGGHCGLAPVLVPWLWPAACLSGVPRGPALVRRSSSGPVALGAPVGFPVDVVPSPGPGAVAPGLTGWLRGARGDRPRTGLIVPAAGPWRGKGAGRAPRRTRSGPRDGVVPGGSLRLRSWAACAAVVWRVWTWSLTHLVSRTVRLATGDSAGAPGLFRVDADTAPSQSEDATPGSDACVRVRALLGRIGRAGLPGAFWCASPFPLAVLGAPLACSAPFGLGLPRLWLLLGFLFFFFFVSFPLLPLVAPPLCPALRVFRPRVPWALAFCPPPPFFPSPPSVRHVVSCFACFPAWGALGLGVLLPHPPPLPPPPPSLLSLAFPAFRLPWASAPPLPPPFFFYLGFLFFLFPFLFFSPFFSFFPSFFAGCAVRGGFFCLGPSSVPRWMLSLSLLCVHWLVLCGVGCWAWLPSAVCWWFYRGHRRVRFLHEEVPLR